MLYLGSVSGSKATKLVNDLSSLLLSKSVVGEEFEISTKDIKVIELHVSKSIIMTFFWKL